MTKRSRPEACEIKWPVDSGQQSDEVNLEKRPGISKGEPMDKLTTVGDTICKEEAISSFQVAVAEVAEEEVLGDGAFWSILSRAGYSSW